MVSGAISNSRAILKGQIFSKFPKLISSILKDIIYNIYKGKNISVKNDFQETVNCG